MVNWNRGLRLIRPITDLVAEGLMRLLNGPYYVDIHTHLESRLSDDRTPSDTYVEYYEDGIEEFREFFAFRTIEYILLVLILLSCLWVVERYILINISLQIVGICLDLLGAAILARGLLSGPIIITHQSSSGYGGYNSELRKSMIQDSIDGAWGIFLLGSGIIVQAVGIL